MHRWSFTPDEPISVRRAYEPYVPKKKPTSNSWVAPEHARMAQGMVRDYPRDDFGKPIRELGRKLVVDKRPTIMIPPRPTYTPL